MEATTSARRRGGRGPRPAELGLDEATRVALERLARAHTTGQLLAQRARIILAAADGLNNTQIGVALGVTAKMARHWRGRWLAHEAQPAAPLDGREGVNEVGIAARLRDAPRPGAPPTFTAEQLCQIVALACEEAPADSGRPTSHWTPRELADEAMKRHIVARISVRTVGRFLVSGSGRAQAPPEPLLAHATRRRPRGVRRPGADGV